MRLNRRKFIQTLGCTGASFLLWPSCRMDSNGSTWRFFTHAEAKTIIAIAEQIIPADQDPGATDAGVANFIDRQLSGFLSHLQGDYRRGLSALSSTCMALYGLQFEKLDWDAQTKVLTDMESGKIEGEYWKENPSGQFFRLLRTHSMAGFYGSPRHGGNRDYVSYKMIKLDYPHVIGQNRYAPRCSTLNVYQP